MERINKFRPAIIATLIAATFSPNLHADVQFRGSVEASLVNQSFDTDSTNSRYEDRNTLQIAPTLTGIYTSKKANASASATQLYQRFDFDEGSRSTNFTEFEYAGNLNVIDNVFQIFGQGSQGYRSFRPETYIASDFLLNSDDLTKITSHSAGATLSIPRGSLWGLGVTGRYFETKSDNTLEEAENDSSSPFNQFINSEGMSANATLVNGDWFKNSYWNINAVFQRTDRQDRGMFESLRANAQIGFNLYKDFGVLFTATHEENDIDGELSNFLNQYNNQFSKFDTYGAGVNYRPAEGRFFNVTLNKISTDGEDDGKTFVGVSTNWQFTPRTSIQADYGRRYYGDAGSFTFNYGTKRVRSAVTYRESTTSFSRLMYDVVDAGTFVCPAGAVDIIDCFQPDSLDYEMQPGEQVVQFSQLVSELTDQVILRRQLGGSIGFQRRRLKVSLDLRYIDTDYSIDDRQQIQKQIGVTGNLQLGSRSSLFSRIQYTQMDNTVNGSQAENDTKIYSIGWSSRLSRGLTVSTDLRYLDGGTNRAIGRDSLDLNETRISLSMTYNFQSNRQ
ncbi:hypothetical protein EXU34_01850 [Alteromonas sp. ZYF713]|nr:hypothetical protein [Alteromonas sp. ZYF713]